MRMKKILHTMIALACATAATAQPLRMQQQAPDRFEAAIRKLVMAAAATNQLYVDTVNCDKLVEDAINGMLSKLDPHSTYSNAKDTKSLTEPLQGSFDGIGVQFNMLEDTLMIIQPVSKGPSERVGILAGDRIINVNDTAIAGVKMSREEIMRRLRGPRGSEVKLGIKRNGVKDLVYFTVTRDKIPVNTLDAAYMVTPTIGLVRFSSFGATTHDEVVDAINRLKARGMKDMVLDLTQNGGGYLNAAAELASEFLPKGKLLVYTKGRTMPDQRFVSTGGSAFQEGRVVVLVDEYTASAAEILTGAIQDHDRGLVVGRRSFGKGLVQRPIDLPDGSMIRLTISHYYTPTGRCIQKPYEKGKKEDYNADMANRLKSGELTCRDSIHLPDSLQYKTLTLGRTVYGGGGIMPDYFIPLDTAMYTRYYREISAKNIIINSNLRYLDKNRKQLTKKYKTFEAYDRDFQVPDDLIKGILDQAEKEKIVCKSDEERQQTLPQLRRMLKALIARDLWDMNEYFDLIYRDNEMVLKAVQLLETNEYNL